MSELYIVRHGQASFGSGHYDRLSAIGEQQSLHLGRYFAAQGLRFDHILTGCMQRHRQTVAGILAGMGGGEVCSELPEFDEYDFEALYTAAAAQFPELDAAQGDVRAYYRGLRRVLRLWAAGEIDAPIPERWDDFQSRIARVRQWIQRNRAGRVLVVSSGGVIAATTQQVLGAPAAAAIELNLQIHNCSVSRYFFNAERFVLSSFNALPQLDLVADAALVTYG